MRITREIAIDAGHRIAKHGGKCQSLHGHRYVIRATVRGSVQDESAGEEAGMIMDFSKLKVIMMEEIDALCDHALILSVSDGMAEYLTHPSTLRRVRAQLQDDDGSRLVQASGVFSTKLVFMTRTPTAENLAEMWGLRIQRRVRFDTRGLARLECLEVDETPNCTACYRPDVKEEEEE